MRQNPLIVRTNCFEISAAIEAKSALVTKYLGLDKNSSLRHFSRIMQAKRRPRYKRMAEFEEGEGSHPNATRASHFRFRTLNEAGGDHQSRDHRGALTPAVQGELKRVQVHAPTNCFQSGLERERRRSRQNEQALQRDLGSGWLWTTCMWLSNKGGA